MKLVPGGSELNGVVEFAEVSEVIKSMNTPVMMSLIHVLNVTIMPIVRYRKQDPLDGKDKGSRASVTGEDGSFEL